ncbi:MAG TPA: LuxR C-terminal-related transcriptional regulator [Anaerolineaceae bacterium]
MPDILSTKLYLPSLPFRSVQRQRVTRRLEEGLAAGARITLVSAPAGFGKSTCAAAWLAGTGLPAAWLSLDPADDDPVRFFNYFLATVQQIDSGVGEEIAVVLRSGQVPSAEFLGEALIGALAQIPRRCILVLDDFHVIQDSYILQVIGRLAAGLPPPAHLVLITREDPALPLARLRAHNQLTEIRAADLRFTLPEADEFLREVMGLRLSEMDTSRLEERTEGWVVGLQLAGLSLRSQPDPGAFIAALSGRHRHILSYLTEEILSRQPEEVVSFLLRTSILGVLSADLCRAVTGRTESAAMLEHLAAANLFLIPLDDEGRWYRYHHLFADLLASQLKQSLPAAAVQELHLRASAWLEENGFLDEAVRHALDGKDSGRAVAILERSARDLMYSGRVSTLRSWLEAVPEADFETYPHLKIYRVWIDLLQGRLDLSEFAMQETDRKLAELPPSPENDALRLELTVILGQFIALSGSTARGIRYAREALAGLPESDFGSRASAYSTLAIAYGLEGEAAQTNEAYRECIRLAQAAGYHTLAANTMMMRGMWLVHYGQLREAARTYQAIIDLGAGQNEFYPAGEGLIGLASIYFEQYDLDRAEDCLRRGLELCTRGGLDGLIPGYIAKSRLCQARGDLTGAVEAIQNLERIFPRADNAFTLTTRQVQLNLALGDAETAARWCARLSATLENPNPARPCPQVLTEMIQAVVARVWLAQGEIEKTLGMLAAVEAVAEPGGRVGRLIEVSLLRGLALQREGRDAAAAVESIGRALALAEPEGFAAVFVEEGEGARTLIESFRRQPAAAKTAVEAPSLGKLLAYAARLLEYFPARADSAGKPQQAAGPLTGREVEVLALIAEGLKYEEIASRLFISVNTVRTYVKGIYGKLGVNNRVEAIQAAREGKILKETPPGSKRG